MKKFLVLALFVALLVVGACSSDDDNTSVPQIDLETGLVGKFELNGNGNDSSPFDNDGTIVGEVTPAPNRAGTINSSMNFQEFMGYIEVGDVPALKLTSQITIAVWVRASGDPVNWDAIVNKWESTGNIDGTGTGYYLGINPDGLTLRWNVSSEIVEMTTPFQREQWEHIAVTFDGELLKLYINGELETEAVAEGALLDNNQPFRIGNQSEDTLEGGFTGRIDDLYVYNRALDAEAVMALYGL